MAGPGQYPYKATFMRDLEDPDNGQREGWRRYEPAFVRYVNIEELIGIAESLSNETTQFFRVKTPLMPFAQTTMRILLHGRNMAVRFIRHDRKGRETILDCAAARRVT